MDTIMSLSGEQRRHTKAFADYIEGRMEKERETVEEPMGKGKITAEYIRYLFVRAGLANAHLPGHC